MDIKFGIIGHGFMGRNHVNALIKMDGMQVVAVADIDPSQLKDIPAGIRSYTSDKELIQDPDVQVVLIAANNNQHHMLVHMAARAGKDIICEKPVAMNSKELEEMVQVCKEHSVRFTVHHQRRLDPDFQTAKAVFESGKLGKIYTIKSSLYGFNGNMHDWHVLKSEGGGMLYDWGVHLLDQMLYMIPDKIKTVYADIRNVINAEVDDYFTIILEFYGGYKAEIELGTYFLSPKPGWFERHWILAGDKGTAQIDGFRPEGTITKTSRLLKNIQGTRTMTAAGPTRSFGPPPDDLLITEPLPEVFTKHADYFENFKRAYRGEVPFLVQIPETARVLRLMEAAWESSNTGQSIAFE